LFGLIRFKKILETDRTHVKFDKIKVLQYA